MYKKVELSKGFVGMEEEVAKKMMLSKRILI